MYRPAETPGDAQEREVRTFDEAPEFAPIPRPDETSIAFYMQVGDEGPLRNIDDYSSWRDEPSGEVGHW